MPSLDFIRDICDYLKKQDIDYYIVALQRNRNKKDCRVDTFAKIEDIISLAALEDNIKDLKKNIDKIKKKTEKSKKSKQ